MNVKSDSRVFFAVIIAAVFGVVSFAGAGRAFAETKIGGVNIQAVLDNSEAGKKSLAELKGKAEKEKGVLEQKLDSIKKLDKELEASKLVAREGALADKETDLRKQKRDLELYRDDIQQTLQKTQSTIMRKLLSDIMRITKEYAQKNGFTLVVERGDTSSTVLGGVVLYLDQAADITNIVIQIYDQEYKNNGGKIGLTYSEGMGGMGGMSGMSGMSGGSGAAGAANTGGASQNK